MILDKNDISNVFGAFHDDDIISSEEKENMLIWKISCLYLAELFKPKYEFFWIKIHNFKDLQLEPWMRHKTKQNIIWTSLGKVFQTELEIISSSINYQTVEITCNQIDDNYDFVGGILSFKCDGIELFTENWEVISVEELRNVFNQYWHGNKNK